MSNKKLFTNELTLELAEKALIENQISDTIEPIVFLNLKKLLNQNKNESN